MSIITNDLSDVWKEVERLESELLRVRAALEACLEIAQADRDALRARLQAVTDELEQAAHLLAGYGNYKKSVEILDNVERYRAAASTRSLAGVPAAGGALTGWRLLEVGEVMQDGDEYFSIYHKQWEKIDALVGEKVQNLDDMIFSVVRRRMSAQRAAPLPDAARVVVEAALNKRRTWERLGKCQDEFPSDLYPGACSEFTQYDDDAQIELNKALDALPPQARGEGEETK